MNTSTTSTTTGDSVTAATSLTSSISTNGSVASHDRSRSTGSAGRSSIRAASPVAAHHHSSPVAIRTRSAADSAKRRAEPSLPEPVSPRIVYGRGTITQLPAELIRLRVSSPLIVSSPSRISLARHIQSLISNLNSRILDSAVVNVPARVVDDAVSRIDDRDVVISVGGASAVGLAKAIGCRKNIPHVCIPTTYSGSEMMPLLLDACPARHNNMAEIAAESSSSKPDSRQRRNRENSSSTRRSKAPRTTSVRDPKVLPSVVIYDEDLTSSLPKRISAPSEEAAVALLTKSRKEDENAQWSYIHLPGV